MPVILIVLIVGLLGLGVSNGGYPPDRRAAPTDLS